MNINKITVLLILASFAMILFFIKYETDNENTAIKKHLKIIPSIITKIEPTGYRGGSINLHVKYYLNEIVKEDYFMVPKTNCNVIGRTIPIIIDSTNANNAELLLMPDDFAKFEIAFPDSLFWTINCFKL